MQELQPVGERVPRPLVAPQYELFGTEAAESTIDEVLGEAAGTVDGRGHRDERHLVEEGGAEEPEQDTAQMPPELLDGRRQVGKVDCGRCRGAGGARVRVLGEAHETPMLVVRPNTNIAMMAV